MQEKPDVMALTRENMSMSNEISILTSMTDSTSVTQKKKGSTGWETEPTHPQARAVLDK